LSISIMVLYIVEIIGVTIITSMKKWRLSE